MLLAGILLVAFALRALIPQGFMPASGRPFSLELCWEGLPTALLAHDDPADTATLGMDSMPMGPMHGHSPGAHHHPGSSSDHCVFGAACSPGPITEVLQPSDFAVPPPLRAVAFVSFASAIRLVYLPQSRAPPAQLS